MKIVVFAASNNPDSINQQLACYAASLAPDAKVQVLDLNDYELPLFSPRREQQLGQPELARAFLQQIASADALIVGFAEYNGTYTTAFKNLYDWSSRIERRIFQHKPCLFVATSPGSQGARSVLNQAVTAAPSFGANLVGSFSLANFHHHFDVSQQKLITPIWLAELQQHVHALRAALSLSNSDYVLINRAS